MVKQTILSTDISLGSYSEFIRKIFELSNYNPSSYVVFANVHMLIAAYQDRQFNDIVNQADLAAPDGRPLSLFLRIFLGIRQPRVCGMDVLPDLIAEAARLKKSVFFYGTTEKILTKVVQRIRREHPTLNIAGYYSPPFRDLSPAEKSIIIEMINNAHPNLVLVSLGCPKQEKWMAEHKSKVHGCMLGLGQAFSTYAGVEKRLPPWMRTLSLEWAYRLYREPRRLWKRYLYTNTLFLVLAFRFVFNRWLSQQRFPVTQKKSL